MRTDLICKAIDMAVRRCPYTTGETIHPALGPRHPGTPPPSSVTTRRATELALRAKASGRHPQGTRGSIRWFTTARSKAIRPSGILPPRSSPVHTIRNDSTPLWGTGRRARSTRSTEQQDKQPETPLSEPSETCPQSTPPVRHTPHGDKPAAKTPAET